MQGTGKGVLSSRARAAPSLCRHIRTHRDINGRSSSRDSLHVGYSKPVRDPDPTAHPLDHNPSQLAPSHIQNTEQNPKPPILSSGLSSASETSHLTLTTKSGGDPQKAGSRSKLELTPNHNLAFCHAFHSSCLLPSQPPTASCPCPHQTPALRFEASRESPFQGRESQYKQERGTEREKSDWNQLS